MDAVTYPDSRVIDFISAYFIPVRIPSDCDALSTAFTVKWTPTLVLLDREGKEHHRTVGFFEPDELIPSLLLGIAIAYFDQDRIDDTLKYLNRLLKDYPKSGSAPEGLYLQGVARFKSGHDPKVLKKAYEDLTAQFPSSEWTKRAFAYRLL